MTRVLLACMMKSGSSFVSRALAEYLDAYYIEPVDYWGRQEQNLFEHYLAAHLPNPFVVQMHLRPHEPNLAVIRRHRIQVVYLWRNLGDVLVSFDDHIRKEDHRNPVAYIHDRARYLSLPDQHRYAYLIEHALPWYAAFHLSWRPFPVVRARYEHLAADPIGFFEGLIEALGHRADRRKLEQVLSSRIEGARFNVGIAGRSLSLLSEATERRIDDFLLRHPEDLADLWAELPWRAGGRPASGSLLRALSGCIYNGRAGTLDPGISGLGIRIDRDDFWFHVPGALLAPGEGRTARLKMVVRGEVGSRFRLHWGRQRLEAPYVPGAGASTVEFLVEGEPPEYAQLDCFNGGRKRGRGEILEFVKIEA